MLFYCFLMIVNGFEFVGILFGIFDDVTGLV